MPEEKAIQLTNRNPEAVWISSKNGKVKIQSMADMTDVQLQKALTIIQESKLQNFMVFLNQCEREVQILKAAKDRNAVLKDVDEMKITTQAAKYTSFKEPMKSAYKSASRKLKQEETV